MRERIYLLLLLIAVAGVNTGSAQFLETTITREGGRVFVIPPETLYNADKLNEPDMVIVLTPSVAGGVAHAVIEEGTQETHIYGRKITYYPNLDDFLLEGDGKIVSGVDELFGPVKVQFIAKENRMVLEGTPQDPAGYVYHMQDGSLIPSKGELFHLIFEEKEGKRVLKTVQAPQGHLGTKIFPKASGGEKRMERKVSGIR